MVLLEWMALASNTLLLCLGGSEFPDRDVEQEPSTDIGLKSDYRPNHH